MSCITKPIDIKSTSLRVRNPKRTRQTVKGTNGQDVKYQQLRANKTPVVTSAVIEETNIITFSGTGFETQVEDGSKAVGYFRGHEGQEYSRTDNQVKVQFELGIRRGSTSLLCCGLKTTN